MNSNFPYTNPYSTRMTSSPKTVEDLLERLETTPSADVLKDLLQQTMNMELASLEWNLSTAVRLVDWVLQFLENTKKSHSTEKNSSLLISIHCLLTKCFDAWDDRIVYAAAVHQDDEDSQKQTLLQHIEELCWFQPQELSDSGSRNHGSDKDARRDNDPLLYATALSALTSAWESLDRLHQVTTCLSVVSSRSSVWWIPDTENRQEWRNVFQFVLNSCGVKADRASSSLYSSTSTNPSSQYSGAPRPEEWKATCVSFLTLLLQHEQMEWIYLCSDQTLDELMQMLSTEAFRLMDPHMPASSFTKLSLMSLKLWIALAHTRGVSFDDENGRLQAGRLPDLMDQVIRAAFANAASSGFTPTSQEKRFRWTQVQQSSFPISIWAQGVLQVLCQSSHVSLQDIVAANPCVQQCGKMGWEALTRHQHEQETPSDEHAMHLFFLHRAFRKASRGTLNAILESQHAMDREGACRQIPINLLCMIRTNDSLWAAGLLVELLHDRCQRVAHDEISRYMWEAIDTRFITQCMELALSRKSHSAASDYHGPKIVCLMDSLRVCLTMESRLCGPTLTLLSADFVESFVNTMCPMTIRVEMMNPERGPDCSQLVGSEESTPPAHNLSRIVDTSLCIAQDQRPRGMDPVIRIATAAVLATIGTAMPVDETLEDSRTLVLQQRMCESVQSFVSDNNLAMVTQIGRNSSLEMTRRRLSLLAAFSHPEHEELLSMAIHAAENTQRQVAQGILQKLDRCTNELKESRQRERKIRLEQEECTRRLVQQSLRSQRELNGLQQKLTFEAAHQIAVHWEERAKAEKYATDLSARVQDAEAREKQAETQLGACRASEAQARSMVEESTRKLGEMQSRERELRGRVESSETSLRRVSAELDSIRTAYTKASQNEKKLILRVEQQSALVVEAEESEDAMRESLESLFADLVSLARLYEIKEKEVSSSEEHGASVVEDLKRKLAAEKKRNSEMLEQFEQVKYENEVLSQKYAKTREKLELERKEWQRENVLRKRTGSTSYINQLDVSTRSGLKSGSRGKENESHRSAETSSHRSRGGRSYR